MKPEGFNTIRSLTQKPIEKTSLMPLKYLICGAKNWEIFQKEIDSGVLNQTGVTEYLPPISEKDFKDMWRWEASKKDISQASKAKLIKEMDWAYKKSGGVPFYGKIIGNYICRQNSCPDYSELRPFFHELLNNQFNNSQVSILINLVNGVQPQIVTDNMIELVKEGIIANDISLGYHINIDFLSDYIKVNYSDKSIKTTSQNNNDDTYIKLVDDIFIAIRNINITRRAKNMDYIFHPTDSDDTQTRMKTICSSRNDLESFTKHVYITYSERTSNYRDGQRIENTYGASLPDSFKSTNSFYRAIGTLRHMHVHSDFRERNNQMSILESLNYFGIEQIPITPKDCAELQLSILKRMNNVLIEMLDYVRKEKNDELE